MDSGQSPGKSKRNSEQKASPSPSPLDEDVEAHETDTLLSRGENRESANKADSQNEDEDMENTISQGIVNLLGVDVERVADFCGYNMDLLRGVVKIIIATAFLVVLLGWMR